MKLDSLVRWRHEKTGPVGVVCEVNGRSARVLWPTANSIWYPFEDLVCVEPPTRLPLSRPLAGLLDACRDAGRPLSQRDLGERRHTPVTQPTVANAISSGDGIALANLAAYARAAGLRLWVGTSDTQRLWDVSENVRAGAARETDALRGLGVGPLRDALAGLGLEMVLTVEEMGDGG
jgi:hypothetical protein